MNYWIGLILKIIIVLFLLFDAGIKIIKHPQALVGSEKMGFSASSTQLLGFVLLLFTVIFLIPRTSIFGLILLAAYLGGATAAMLIAKMPGHPYFFPIIVGIVLWISQVLTDSDLKFFLLNLK